MLRIIQFLNCFEFIVVKDGIKQEIKLLQKLDHKNIIKLHEVYEGKNHIYFVLDYLNGGELFQKLKKKIIFSEQEAANFMKSFLEALQCLHSKGIMHRDIKPANLMFRNQGSSIDIVLIDFGLAEQIGTKKMIFQKCGTPGFIAPEILRNEKYNGKVDVFSAGVVLYRILTGVKLFHGKTSQDTLKLNKECLINFDFPHLSYSTIEYLKLLLNGDPNQRLNSTDALNHE